jgi:hypothetical protein
LGIERSKRHDRSGNPEAATRIQRRIPRCHGKEDALALRAELHKFYVENHVTKEQREIIVFGFGERLSMLCSM